MQLTRAALKDLARRLITNAYGKQNTAERVVEVLDSVIDSAANPSDDGLPTPGAGAGSFGALSGRARDSANLAAELDAAAVGPPNQRPHGFTVRYARQSDPRWSTGITTLDDLSADVLKLEDVIKVVDPLPGQPAAYVVKYTPNGLLNCWRDGDFKNRTSADFFDPASLEAAKANFPLITADPASVAVGSTGLYTRPGDTEGFYRRLQAPAGTPYAVPTANDDANWHRVAPPVAPAARAVAITVADARRLQADDAGQTGVQYTLLRAGGNVTLWYLPADSANGTNGRFAPAGYWQPADGSLARLANYDLAADEVTEQQLIATDLTGLQQRIDTNTLLPGCFYALPFEIFGSDPFGILVQAATTNTLAAFATADGSQSGNSSFLVETYADTLHTTLAFAPLFGGGAVLLGEPGSAKATLSYDATRGLLVNGVPVGYVGGPGPATTDDLPEGTQPNRRYFTDARAQAVITDVLETGYGITRLVTEIENPPQTYGATGNKGWQATNNSAYFFSAGGTARIYPASANGTFATVRLAENATAPLTLYFGAGTTRSTVVAIGETVTLQLVPLNAGAGNTASAAVWQVHTRSMPAGGGTLRNIYDVLTQAEENAVKALFTSASQVSAPATNYTATNAPFGARFVDFATGRGYELAPNRADPDANGKAKPYWIRPL